MPKPTPEQNEQAVALLSAILHRLEIRGVQLNLAEDRLWELATQLQQGMPKLGKEQLERFIDLTNVPTT